MSFVAICSEFCFLHNFGQTILNVNYNKANCIYCIDVPRLSQIARFNDLMNSIRNFV